MYNVIRYHNSDKGPSIQSQWKTKAEAVKELKATARVERAKKSGENRYEVRGRGYAIAIYIEKD